MSLLLLLRGAAVPPPPPPPPPPPDDYTSAKYQSHPNIFFRPLRREGVPEPQIEIIGPLPEVEAAVKALEAWTPPAIERAPPPEIEAPKLPGFEITDKTRRERVLAKRARRLAEQRRARIVAKRTQRLAEARERAKAAADIVRIVTAAQALVARERRAASIAKTDAERRTRVQSKLLDRENQQRAAIILTLLIEDDT